MSFSKILFVGLGGAGQRHLRVFHRLLGDSASFFAYRQTRATPLLRPDFTVDDKGSLEQTYGIRPFNTLDAAFAARPDLTVIATPTACHRTPMMLAVEAGSGVMVEKPWAENLIGFPAFRGALLSKRLPFQISFQRRYHPQIARAHRAFSDGLIGRPQAAVFTAYSYVPDWHPYEDWRRLYAVRNELGGGVLLTEIHEIDLINWFFGLPEAVFCAGGNYGAQALPVEDTVSLILMYRDFSVQVNLCFMQKRPNRTFQITGTSGTIEWNAQENKLAICGADGSKEVDVLPELSNDSMFVDQAKHLLFNWTPEDTLGSLAAAADSLAVVEAAKRSMASRRAEPVSGISSAD
ncbi:MAG: Gfo/Idh/MocA family oxidoreductase [Betaproteobacteria bacterium]|nr:Gfo/Idh/MocA family oxidoreductase [Betaproteobacteria bacterium]